MALGAQFAWGLFPLYWKQIAQVPSGQVIAHRIAWSFITLVAIALWRGHGLREIGPRAWRLYAIAAVLISVNWFAYIWAVSNHLIVETSLGYFINPLMTVLIGVLAFGEKLRPAQWLAVGCATAGVIYLTVTHGALPWIALALAATFSSYSAVKKLAPLGSLDGLTVETAWVTVPAIGYLVYEGAGGRGSFYTGGLETSLYLAGGGLVTTLPLVLFAAAVRNVPLTTIGVLQYISPMLQLALGVLFFHEPFVREQLIGFSGVWIGLLIFSVDAARNR